MKVLFVSAAGYGNIGDDTYPAIFKREYGDKHKLIFMNSDVKPIPKDLDLMVFGGGGLIFDKPGEEHFDHICRYMDHALEHKIPYGFTSVGIQCRKKQGKWDHHSYAARWMPYFKKAAWASVRDQLTLDYIVEKTGRKDFIFAPDLCYLFKSHEVHQSRGYILVIPGAKINIDNKQVADMIRGQRVVFMNMGGAGTDRRTKQFMKKYKGAKTYLSANLYPSLAFKLIAHARLVITGRYHGMIFSRIAQVPFWINDPSQYKIQVEDLDVPMEAAAEHLKLLSKFLR